MTTQWSPLHRGMRQQSSGEIQLLNLAEVLVGPLRMLLVFSPTRCTQFVGLFYSLYVNLQSALGCVGVFTAISSEWQVIELVSHGEME